MENPDELDDYGLAEPAYTLKYTSDGEENQYIMVEGSILAYQIGADVVGNMIEVSEEEVAEE